LTLIHCSFVTSLSLPDKLPLLSTELDRQV